MRKSILVHGRKSLSLIEVFLKPTEQPTMKFSQLICWGESRLESKFLRICMTDFELFLISHSLSLQKICLTGFYYSLHEC